MTDTRGHPAIPRSAVAGVEWPGIPSVAAAAMLAILEQMEATQWWSAQELDRHQRRQLHALLRHAVAHVPYYGGEPPAPAAEAAGEVEPSQWTQLPVLTRSEVQEHFEALCSRDIPAGHGRVSGVSTSGSTGQPVTIRMTDLARTFSGVCGLRAHRWHRREVGERLAAIHLDPVDQATYPDGLQQPGWGWPTGEIYHTGPAALLNLRTPIALQAEWLQRQQASYLLSCPSNLMVLAEYCLEHGISLPDLRDVATIMEVVTPELREACRAAWGVPVVDMYTTREAGCIAVQCPDHEHYHVMAESVLVEILDDHDRPCAPGEVGRVVATPLHNFAMPLLRYDLGDYAEVGEPCPCGRGLPVLARVLGRVRNMLILPDGQRVWPSFGRRRMVAAAPIRQHQVVQRDLRTLELRLVTERPLTAEEEGSIRQIMAQRLPARFDIEFRYLDHIERGPGGKFEDFRSEVP